MEQQERTFRIGPIRPPSEANSLLLQVTNGCTWNKCKFCQLYRHTKFKAYSADSIKADIDNIAYQADIIRRYQTPLGAWDIDGLNQELGQIPSEEERQCFYMVANWLVGGGENVFLQDGNTTALSSGRLSDVLIYLKQAFPGIKRITSYGRAENLSRVSAEEYAELKEAGLDRIHSGFETGSDAVLQKINKGVTQQQEITAGKNIKAGGIELSVYFMPGVGGKELTKENAEGTSHVINEIGPDFLRIRTAAVKPGTGLYEDYQNGQLTLCSDEEKLLEIKTVIERAAGNRHPGGQRSYHKSFAGSRRAYRAGQAENAGHDRWIPEQAGVRETAVSGSTPDGTGQRSWGYEISGSEPCRSNRKSDPCDPGSL